MPVTKSSSVFLAIKCIYLTVSQLASGMRTGWLLRSLLLNLLLRLKGTCGPMPSEAGWWLHLLVHTDGLVSCSPSKKTGVMLW